jgi:hypothetical protein
MNAYGMSATLRLIEWVRKGRGLFLDRRKEIACLGHRSGGDMPSLISPLKSVINTFFNG